MLAFSIYHTPYSADFWARMNDGIGLQAGSAILFLRNRLIEDKASKSRLKDFEKLALTIKAHNAWRRGQQVAALRWRSFGEKVELFPRWIT